MLEGLKPDLNPILTTLETAYKVHVLSKKNWPLRLADLISWLLTVQRSWDWDPAKIDLKAQKISYMSRYVALISRVHCNLSKIQSQIWANLMKSRQNPISNQTNSTNEPIPGSCQRRAAEGEAATTTVGHCCSAFRGGFQTFVIACLQGDTSLWFKPPVDINT